MVQLCSADTRSAGACGHCSLGMNVCSSPAWRGSADAPLEERAARTQQCNVAEVSTVGSAPGAGQVLQFMWLQLH